LIDAVIASGHEGGGHVGRIGTMVLVPRVVDQVRIPVIAAGGLAVMSAHQFFADNALCRLLGIRYPICQAGMYHTPDRSTAWACLAVPTSAITFVPAAWACGTIVPGSPRPATMTGTPSSNVTSMWPLTSRS
jgi:Nitronate monooxygenase